MKAEGKAIVFITHKLGEVLETADSITILRRGRVTAHMEVPPGVRRVSTAGEARIEKRHRPQEGS